MIWDPVAAVGTCGGIADSPRDPLMLRAFDSK